MFTLPPQVYVHGLYQGKSFDDNNNSFQCIFGRSFQWINSKL